MCIHDTEDLSGRLSIKRWLDGRVEYLDPLRCHRPFQIPLMALTNPSGVASMSAVR